MLVARTPGSASEAFDDPSVEVQGQVQRALALDRGWQRDEQRQQQRIAAVALD
jgi:hypothetical protein